jgi:hypothetical protein
MKQRVIPVKNPLMKQRVIPVKNPLMKQKIIVNKFSANNFRLKTLSQQNASILFLQKKLCIKQNIGNKIYFAFCT